MKKKIRYYRLIWLKHDLPAGIAVFLVALPLCLGIALASGMPVYAGLFSGIIGGIVVSAFSGSQLAVSGPAAGLSTLVAASLLSFGDVRLFLLSVIVAGLFQILLGVLKMGSIAYYFPSSVIKGMLAAIGILLASKQIPLAIGFDKPDFWTSGFLSLFDASHLTGNFNSFSEHITRSAVLIAVVSLVLMIFLQSKKGKAFKIIPAPLLVVLTGIGINFLFKETGFALKPTQLVQVPDRIFDKIMFPDLSQLFSSIVIWKTGVVIGLLATLETLLCIEAIDKLDKHNRITPVNRELIAQGIGNVICGIAGALPVTAVVVRGAANIDAGARTKLSALTHGILLLLAVLFLVPFINAIPYASLAAILLVTGYNLTRPALYIKMWKLGMKQFIPFLITILVILFTDLLAGVTIGLLISIYFIIQNNFQAEYKISKYRNHDIDHYTIGLNSNVTFLNKVKLRRALDEIPEYSVLIIDGSNCNFIDYDILEIISDYHSKAHDRHIEIHLENIERVEVMGH